MSTWGLTVSKLLPDLQAPVPDGTLLCVIRGWVNNLPGFEVLDRRLTLSEVALSPHG